MSSENTGLLYSRSVSKPRLNASVNVSLDDILWLAEPFVTKPSMLVHHCKPKCYVWKSVSVFNVKVTVTEFGFIQWNHDYFYYMFWTADFLVTNLVWQYMFISWSVFEKVALLYSRSRSQWRFWTSVNVCPNNISDWSNLVWWCIIISQSIIQKYNFAMFTVEATIVSTRSSEILKLMQSKLVLWCITKKWDKTLWKDFLVFTQGMRAKMAWVTVD